MTSNSQQNSPPPCPAKHNIPPHNAPVLFTTNISLDAERDHIELFRNPFLISSSPSPSSPSSSLKTTTTKFPNIYDEADVNRTIHARLAAYIDLELWKMFGDRVTDEIDLFVHGWIDEFGFPKVESVRQVVVVFAVWDGKEWVY